MTMILLVDVGSAAPSNQTLSFSARLKNSSGGVVADGYYNITFRLYSQQSAGSTVWSETYHDANGPAAGQDNRIRVANGYFSVKLGSLEPFTDVDWTGDLFLTMDIGGTTQVANTESIDWDGEMTPRIQLSAMPYAMNAQRLGGKTADQFLQVGSGVQDIGNNASIAINKTGSGDLMQFQSSGINAFTLHETGSISLGSVTDQTISVADSTSGPGQSLTLAAGSATSGNNTGGDLVLQAGSGSGTGTDGTIMMDSNITVGAGKTITMVGGATSLRPANPAEGTMYFDTDTKKMLTFVNGKWQADRSTATVIIGTSASGGTSGAVASKSPESADFVNTSTTSAQDTINQAIASLPATGGSIYLMEGTYILDSSILLPSNVTLTGAGASSVLKAGNITASFTPLITTADQSNPSENITIQNLKLHGSSDELGDVYPLGIDFIIPNKQAAHKHIKITGLITESFSSMPIMSATANSEYSSNTFYGDSEGFGEVGIQYGPRNLIANNNFINMTEVYVFDSEDSIITNNTFHGLMYGLSVIGETSGTSVTSNIFRDNEAYGIYLRDTSNVTISGNSISGADISAVEITGASSENKVTSNRISSTDGTGHAIEIASNSVVGTYVSGNTLTGFTEAAIQDHGVDTVYANQLDDNGKMINRSSGGFGVQTSAGSDAMSIDASTGDVAVAGTLEAGSIETASVDTGSAGALAIGANNATSVTIGTNDTAGTLLVLDTKTTAGDPAGTDGAMYYNSDADKFRCYQNGAWQDCLTPLPVMANITTPTQSHQGITNVDGLSFELAANTKYHYKFVVQSTHDSDSSTIGFGVTSPSKTISGHWCANTAEDGYDSGVWSEARSVSYCGTGDATESATPRMVINAYDRVSTIEGYIENGELPGTLQLRMIVLDSGFSAVESSEGFGVLQVVQ